MFRFLQRRPNRAVVFKLDNEDRFRWRCTKMPLMFWGRTFLEPNEVEHHCTTVFVDTIQDSYHGIKNSFADAAGEIREWCELRKISWWVEDAKGAFHRCHLGKGGLTLPESLQKQLP